MASFLTKALTLIRRILPLARFDLFLQGTLLMLIFFDGVVFQLLRRSAAADMLPYNIHNWVIMACGGAEVLFGSLLGWLGTSKKNYSLAGWLAASGISGLLVVIVPQPSVDSPNVGLCNGGDIVLSDSGVVSTIGIIDENYYLGIRTTLIIANLIFNALAKVAVYALGITYLDSHDPSNGPLYLGILITIRVSMSINAENWMGGPSFGDYWFRAQISMSCLIIMFALLFCLFPKKMPGYKVPALPQDGMGFFTTLKRILSNKTVIVQTIALSFLNTGLWGYINNEQAYVQSRYYKQQADGWGDGWTSRAAAGFLRTFIIVYCMGVFRARFSGRRSNGVKATTAAKVAGGVAFVAGAFFVVLAFIHCTATPLVGLEDDGYMQPECSNTCGCESEKYGFAPVCNIDDHETYFSPCHAGCSDYEDFNGVLLFSNCTCGSGPARFVSSACDVSSCHGMFSLYMLIYVNALALSGGTLLMQSMVILRAVETHDQPTAVGTSMAIIAAFAFLPGHYLYMFISDTTCAWMDNEHCLVHHKTVAPILAGVTGGFIITSGILSIVAFIFRRKETSKTAL